MAPSVPIPGPRRIPLLGPVGSMVRFFRDPIRCMRHLHATYGNIAAVSHGDPSLVCLFGPELNRQVLSDPNSFHNRELPLRIPERSPLRAEKTLVGKNGAEHQRLRRAMLPLFQKSHLDHHRDEIVAATQSYLSHWRPGQVVDLSEVTAELALCVSFRCLFGLDITAERRVFADLALGFLNGATSPKTMLFPFELPGTPYWRFAKLCDRLEDHLRKLVEERRSSTSTRYDVLSILMSARDDDNNALDDSLLIGLVNEMFLAGHESTARTLGWTLLLLEQHPAILHDLVDELSSVLHGEAPTVEQLKQLPLLDAVVKESMRVLAPLPFLFLRRNSHDTPVGPYNLPAGATVVISPLITHHLPELYPEPRRFKPERWSADTQPSAYEYLPFGAGPRTCLGAAFATVSLRVMLSLILQRFRLSLVEPTDVSFRVRGPILATKAKLSMRIGPVNGATAGHPVRGTIRELVQLS